MITKQVERRHNLGVLFSALLFGVLTFWSLPRLRRLVYLNHIQSVSWETGEARYTQSSSSYHRLRIMGMATGNIFRCSIQSTICHMAQYAPTLHLHTSISTTSLGNTPLAMHGVRHVHCSLSASRIGGMGSGERGVRGYMPPAHRLILC